MRIVFASRNQHKRDEVGRILRHILGDVTLVEPGGVEPEENGTTFAENALIKARAAFADTGTLTIADDSGLVVDSLGGAPGIHSARYSESGSDRDNVSLLLKNLGDTSSRQARFVCAAVLVSDREEHIIERSWSGTIAREPAGEGGFGYDPVFIPAGYGHTVSQMSQDDKDILSHRGQAFRQLATILQPSYQ
jgi:XTP/dITP diphosphohydrolase